MTIVYIVVGLIVWLVIGNLGFRAFQAFVNKVDGGFFSRESEAAHAKWFTCLGPLAIVAIALYFLTFGLILFWDRYGRKIDKFLGVRD